MKKIFITFARANELYRNHTKNTYSSCYDLSGTKKKIEIPDDTLTEQERKILRKKYDGKHYLFHHEGNYCLGDGEFEQKKKDFTVDADELKLMIYSFIEQINTDKVIKKDRHKNIEGIVDKIQDLGHPKADNVLALYHVLKAIETIRKYRKQARMLETEFDDNGIFFDESAGLIKIKFSQKIAEDESLELKGGQKNTITPICIRDATVEELLTLMLREIELPNNVTI